MHAPGAGAWGLVLACAMVPHAGAVERFHREPVLGTSLELQVAGTDAATAQRMLAEALDEIARQDAVLSGWRADSALARLNAGAADADPPAALREVLVACEQWRARTAGAFSCRLGALAGRWRQAEAEAALPERTALRRAARAIDAARFDPQAPALALPDGVRMDVDGLAKGYILDRTLERLRARFPQVRGIALDIGGDGAYWGEGDDGRPWPVVVADPAAPEDNGDSRGIARLRVRAGAVAASGHSSRGYRVGRRRFSHILDPADGWPVVYAPSATVVAPDAATADALATALTVMPIRDGLALVDGLPGVAALIVGEQGVPFASARWSEHLDPAFAGTVPARRAQPCRLQVDYQIPGIEADRYRNPYLALWIARADGTPVRQLLVLGDRGRWLGELPAWWRHYGRNDPAAAQGIARPTRRPGAYRVGWDGRDDAGRAVAAGAYVLHAQAAREHGGRESLHLPFDWSAQARAASARGHAEIGRIDLRPVCRTD
ncbi:DUF2271 domain-containing protein [Pseudoxanthomonas broegbernensis]|nr:DUF2271 domain-containing protein [Pseudoxanthomonas broegbernensis]MBB6063605.1 thiamine biosynthesis lipoprotein [Pseudoxanthomonas broegbernensis]